MLQTMRSHAGSWFIKFLLGAIVASFALWGITDIIRGYGHNRPVATVGSRSISVDEFAHAYKMAISNIQQRMKAALTPDQLREIGLPNQVLENAINNAAMELDVQNLGLVVSDKIVKDEIHAIPAFLHKDGSFNMEVFKQILQSQGISEARFVQDVRGDIQRHQLISGMTSGLDLSDDYLRVLFQALEQPIQFVAIDIPFKKMALPKSIDTEALQNFYNANKEQFRLPELRTLTLIRFDRDALKKNISVSTEEIDEVYAQSKDEFLSPEKRHIESLTLTSSDAAKKADDLFKMGKPLKTIARELKGTHKDLGTIALSEFHNDHGKDVFALDSGALSQPYDVSNGWVVYSVTKIIPGVKQSEEQARAAIESSLKDDKFNAYFENLQNQVEDALAGGEKIHDVATKYGLIIETLKAVDKFGRDQDGKDIVEEQISKDILSYAFSNNQGSESNVILAKSTGADSKLVGFIVRIDAIQNSSVPEFDVIQDKISEAYKTDFQNKAAATMANELIKDVKSLEDLKKQAASRKLNVVNLPLVSRSTVDQNDAIKNDMTTETIERMFTLPEGESLIAPAKGGFKVIMFQSKQNFSFDNDKFNKFKEGMKHMLEGDFQKAYRNYLRHSLYPVTINAEQMNHVVGHASSD